MSIDVKVPVGKETLQINTGYLAKQADGSVALSYGETVVFATAVISREVREGQDFFPLTVDYREKTYAAGKIPGGFIKRENRPSDREILVSRLSDRPLRPLFPDGFINEVQIIIYVLSADRENQQDVVAINAASSALMVSGAPFKGPVGAVRIGRVNGTMVVNPTFSEMNSSDIDLVVAGTKKAVTMIEGSSKNVSEADMISAVKLAHENIIKICEAQEDLARQVGKEPFRYEPFVPDADLQKEVRARYFGELEGLSSLTKKMVRQDAIHAIIEKAKKELAETFPDTVGQCGSVIDALDGEIVRRRILEEGKRADGRGLKDIRPIDIMLGILPRAHGSAVFTRGETQSLGVTTLGSMHDAQRMDNIEGESEKRFMLHYHFPPFSVGETGRTGGVGRREIGHGMLAERALEYVIPEASEFPYTIRQVSEILESNGSSSMATVCSGSLSLFNAGVPVKASVAGIAMGLVMEGDRFAILSDILGLEDHLGDMDFKVAGTTEGITAFQMDIKIEGITPEIMEVALAQAREGRIAILRIMNDIIAQPESQLSAHAPKIRQMTIDPTRIGEVIGQGGRIIKRIIEETKADINIEDDGTITICAVEDTSINGAVDFINRIVKELEVGAIYEGTVVKIMDFGAFVEIAPGKDGLVHISKLDRQRVNKVTDVVKVGEKVKVKVIKIDNNGRIDLSRKDVLD
ncbi:MAG TPA: polyribonucleotide nucleotidyltransferase [Spirochaetota bacterium]|nr:polyribonucleotide nucleotidyltransferase [Spirochaetota bacterium]HPI89740.1 polyribonucleotide nucleotidyltransferase [Spirochaetota bacterium]HPR46627.1 polyribonucleotide nucleotidyltransferase [Spirochaetota bacterium]